VAGQLDRPDWAVVRRAWWDVVKLVYASVESPLRLCLELRVMAGSGLVMAPQRGNDGQVGRHGTASIEVLTLPDAVDDREWVPFVERVVQGWMGLGAVGEVRPHWGKEWYVSLLSLLLNLFLLFCFVSVCFAFPVIRADASTFLIVRAQLTLADRPAAQYFKHVAYKSAIPEFKAILAEIGQGQGWGLSDLKARFSNRLWDEIVFED